MDNYADIMRHARYTLKKHRTMTVGNRAAQFAPFAVLTGYEEAVDETALLTDMQRELTEDEQDMLNQKLRMLAENKSEHPAVAVTYFQPDARKSGGAYVTAAGNLRFLDEAEMLLKLTDSTAIPIPNITDIQIRRN